MEHNQFHKSIFLTFDDGPNEPYTSQILNVLAAHGAKATFFVCGMNIEKYPEVLQRVVAYGHAVGIHSYSHNLKKVLRGDLMQEIVLTRELIRRYAHVDTKLCRSPWGITRPKLKQQLLFQGYQLFYWDIMAFDWRRPDLKMIAGHVIRRAFPGALVLLHDGEGIRSGERTNTVKSLPLILDALGRQGYTFESLSQNSSPRLNSLKSITADNLAWLLQ